MSTSEQWSDDQSDMDNIRDNFYVTGGTLRHDAPSYVERRADTDLFEGLKRGEFCYVLTSRQMGKSSLMVRTAQKLREQGVGVVVIDLTAIGQNLTPEQWYDGLIVGMGRQLRLENELEDFWMGHQRFGPCQRLFAAISDLILPKLKQRCDNRANERVDGATESSDPSVAASRLVLFVDELDTVRSLPFSTDEFFAGIRECYNRRTQDPAFNGLTFCLLGVATPSDLIRDARTTPFNIGQRIELTDFTFDEALPLSRGLRADGQLGRVLLERVYYWTQGHPYLTQVLCQAVAADSQVVGASGVDQLCHELFLSLRARERDDNLIFVRERLLRNGVELAGLLDLYAQILSGKSVADDITNPLVGVLRLSGITSANANGLQVRNRIYQRVFNENWVKQNMPGAELRRQRAAFRRGVMRAALVAPVVLIILIGLFSFQGTSRTQKLTNGSTITLRPISFGKYHRFEAGPFRVAWLGDLLPPLRHWVGQGITITNEENSLLVGIVCGGNDVGPAHEFNAVLVDKSGYEFSSTSERGAGISKANVIRAWEFTRYPRRESSFRLRLDGRVGDNQWSQLAVFPVDNPDPRKYPVWAPEPLPSTHRVGDLSVTLKRVLAGSPGSQADIGFSTRGWPGGMVLSFEISDHGQRTSVWGPVGCRVVDATGNSWLSYNSWRNDEGDWAIEVRLPESEVAFKIETEFEKDSVAFTSGELWTVSKVPIPAPQSFIKFDTVVTNLQGATLRFLGITGSNASLKEEFGFRSFEPLVQIEFSSPSNKDLGVKLVRATSDLGQDLLGRTAGSSADVLAWGLRPTPGSKSVDFAFGVYRRHKVEFLVAPTRFSMTTTNSFSR